MFEHALQNMNSSSKVQAMSAQQIISTPFPPGTTPSTCSKTQPLHFNCHALNNNGGFQHQDRLIDCFIIPQHKSNFIQIPASLLNLQLVGVRTQELHRLVDFLSIECCVLWDCVTCIFTVKFERIRFLVIAIKDTIEIYAWAPKPYHKFMSFKVSRS